MFVCVSVRAFACLLCACVYVCACACACASASACACVCLCVRVTDFFLLFPILYVLASQNTKLNQHLFWVAVGMLQV